jgi:hypothetical protein
LILAKNRNISGAIRLPEGLSALSRLWSIGLVLHCSVRITAIHGAFRNFFKAQLALIMRAVRSVGFLRRRRVSRGEFGVLE